MSDNNPIIEKLERIEQLIIEQNLLKKDVLNFSEACQYLSLSESHLYKLTSNKSIPHFCPQGKRLYFNRAELDEWLQRNKRIKTADRMRKRLKETFKWMIKLFPYLIKIVLTLSY